MTLSVIDKRVTVTLESSEEVLQVETADSIVGIIGIDPEDGKVKFQAELGEMGGEARTLE